MRRFSRRKYGGIAQLARAFGSYPKCHRFESSYRYHITGFCWKLHGRGPQKQPADRAVQHLAKPCAIWPVGQAVKTSPFHGGNPGSIPGRVTKQNKSEPYAGWRRVRICCLYGLKRCDLEEISPSRIFNDLKTNRKTHKSFSSTYLATADYNAHQKHIFAHIKGISLYPIGKELLELNCFHYHHEHCQRDV